jgi:PAS domain-containing protein
MSDAASHLAFLRDPRLAALATSATPAWLWSTDATRILWANPVGAAVLGLASPAALAARRFDPKEQTAAQIARLLGTLRLGGGARLERLRGFGTGFGRALLCGCSRVTLADHTAGVLVAAMEPAGPALTLAERVRRLYDGAGVAVAAFTPDGTLLHATPDGRARLGAATTLAALGAERLGADAIANGRADGDIPGARATVERLGADGNTVLALTFAEERAAAPAPIEPPTAAPPAEPPRTPREPPPQEVVAPPTVPAAPIEPEAPPVAPDMPDASGGQPAPTPAAAPEGAAEQTGEASPEKPVPPLRIDVPLAERRHPLRFVWQMDANGRFTLGSDEFTEVIGPHVAIALGRTWNELNTELALDPEGQVARAVATHDTWSGITVSWPVDGIADRLKVELSGLPIYDRNRNFLGYRGFGVCRDVDRLATLAEMRRSSHAAAPPTTTTTPEATEDARPAMAARPAAANVVPFRSPAPTPEPKAPTLSPVERNTFHELARQLTARLKGNGEPAAPGEADAAEPQAAGEAAPLAAAAPAPTPAPAHAPTTDETVAPAEPASPALAAAAEAAVATAPGEPVHGPVQAALAEAVPQSAQSGPTDRALLDRIPVGVLV